MGKKERIIESALRLFVNNGFHGTATGKIAQEAGVATGTLFNYFKSKDELVIGLYIIVKEELSKFILKTTVGEKSLKEVMKLQFLASLFWALDNDVKFRFIQQFHSSPYLRKVEQEVIQSQVLPHLELIQKGISEKVLKPLPVDLMYSIISSQTFGLYHYLATKDLSRMQQHEIIQQTFEILWEMIS